MSTSLWNGCQIWLGEAIYCIVCRSQYIDCPVRLSGGRQKGNLRQGTAPSLSHSTGVIVSSSIALTSFSVSSIRSEHATTWLLNPHLPLWRKRPTAKSKFAVFAMRACRLVRPTAVRKNAVTATNSVSKRKSSSRIPRRVMLCCVLRITTAAPAESI